MWQLVSRGKNHSFVAVKNVLITLYWGAPELHSLHDRGPWAHAALERYGSIGQVAIIDRRTVWSMPSAEWRALSREQSKSFEAHVELSTVVVEPDDLSGALVRTLARGLAMTLALDRQFRVRIFDNVVDAFAFVERTSSTNATAAELGAAVDAIRAGGESDAPSV